MSSNIINYQREYVNKIATLIEPISEKKIENSDGPQRSSILFDVRNTESSAKECHVELRKMNLDYQDIWESIVTGDN